MPRFNSSSFDFVALCGAGLLSIVACGAKKNDEPPAPKILECRTPTSRGLVVRWNATERTARLADEFWSSKGDLMCERPQAPCKDADCETWICRGQWSFRAQEMTFATPEFQVTTRKGAFTDSSATSNTQKKRVPLHCKEP